MAQTRITTTDFDPFEFSWLFFWWKNRSTWWIALFTLLIPLIAGAAAAMEGTFGGMSDVQAADDLTRIFDLGETSYSAPSFPFMRDIYSWTQALTVMFGTVLLHRQWQHMSMTLSTLARTGALVAKQHRHKNVAEQHKHENVAEQHRHKNIFSKLLLIDRMAGHATPENALDVFVSKLMTSLAKVKTALQLTLLLAAFLLALLLTFGQKRSLFLVLAPKGLDGAARTDWLERAYTSWWASEPHTVGHIVYLFIAAYAIYVILNFQIPGLLAIYVLAGLYFLADPSADWLNRDSCFGWSICARTFRTVIIGNLLLAFTLLDILVFIGAHNFTWIFGLLGLYTVSVPLFVFVPWAVFGKTEQKAKRLRVAEIEALIAAMGIDTEKDLEKAAPYIAEIERVHAAKIRPLRVRKWSVSTFVILVLIPIVLAAAQIFFEFRLGGG